MGRIPFFFFFLFEYDFLLQFSLRISKKATLIFVFWDFFCLVGDIYVLYPLEYVCSLFEWGILNNLALLCLLELLSVCTAVSVVYIHL